MSSLLRDRLMELSPSGNYWWLQQEDSFQNTYFQWNSCSYFIDHKKTTGNDELEEDGKHSFSFIPESREATYTGEQ